MKKQKLTATLIDYALEDLTKGEAKFLAAAISELTCIYKNGGISLHTLLRQQGLTETQFQYILTNETKLREQLAVQQENPSRVSKIFPDEMVYPILLDKCEDIVDLLHEGNDRDTIYRMLYCIPSRRTWEKFRRNMKKQGIDLKKIERTIDDNGQEYLDAAYA